MYRIMLVDDEESVLKSLRRLLKSETVEDHEGKESGFAVETFSAAEPALARAAEVSFDLVVSDYRMPGMNGVEFLRRLKGTQPDIVCLILSGYVDLDGLIYAINEVGIFRFIAKPWHNYELMDAITRALAYRALLLENQRLADLVRVQQGHISQRDVALKKLEREHPLLTKVHWGPDGSVLLED